MATKWKLIRARRILENTIPDIKAQQENTDIKSDTAALISALLNDINSDYIQTIVDGVSSAYRKNLTAENNHNEQAVIDINKGIVKIDAELAELEKSSDSTENSCDAK